MSGGAFILLGYVVLVAACGWWGLALAGGHIGMLVLAAWLKG